jgi:uncharacterized membrane protein SpoIIM required for sporulation
MELWEFMISHLKLNIFLLSIVLFLVSHNKLKVVLTEKQYVSSPFSVKFSNQIVNNSFTSFQLYCNHIFIGGKKAWTGNNDLIDESCGLATKRDVG